MIATYKWLYTTDIIQIRRQCPTTCYINYLCLLWNHFLTWQWRIWGCICPHSVRWLGNTCPAVQHPLPPLSSCSVGPAPLHLPASSVSLSVGINILYIFPNLYISQIFFINARCTCLTKPSTGNMEISRIKVANLAKARWFAKRKTLHCFPNSQRTLIISRYISNIFPTQMQCYIKCTKKDPIKLSTVTVYNQSNWLY